MDKTAREVLAELVAAEDLKKRADKISPVEPGFEKEVLMDEYRRLRANAFAAARALLAEPPAQAEREVGIAAWASNAFPAEHGGAPEQPALRRYSTAHDYPYMREHPGGAWVLYDDACAAIASRQPAEVPPGWPHNSEDEKGNAVLEWWCGERKITMYPMDGMLLKVWGINCSTEMDEVRLEDASAVKAAFQWLRAAAPPAAAPESADSEQALDARRYRWLREKFTQHTGYDVYGDGGNWTAGVFSDDHRKPLDEAIDAAIAATKERT